MEKSSITYGWQICLSVFAQRRSKEGNWWRNVYVTSPVSIQRENSITFIPAEASKEGVLWSILRNLMLFSKSSLVSACKVSAQRVAVFGSVLYSQRFWTLRTLRSGTELFLIVGNYFFSPSEWLFRKLHRSIFNCYHSACLTMEVYLCNTAKINPCFRYEGEKERERDWVIFEDKLINNHINEKVSSRSP